jgi:hypothetical protein
MGHVIYKEIYRNAEYLNVDNIHTQPFSINIPQSMNGAFFWFHIGATKREADLGYGIYTPTATLYKDNEVIAERTVIPSRTQNVFSDGSNTKKFRVEKGINIFKLVLDKGQRAFNWFISLQFKLPDEPNDPDIPKPVEIADDLILTNSVINSESITIPVIKHHYDISTNLKSDDSITDGNLFIRIFAKTKVGFDLSAFGTSQVKIFMNDEFLSSMNFDLNIIQQQKQLDFQQHILLKNNDRITLEFDFGFDNMAYDVVAGIIGVTTQKNRKLSLSRKLTVEKVDEGGNILPNLGIGLGAIALGLGAVLLLSTGGGRTIIYKGAKAGYKKIKNR